MKMKHVLLMGWCSNIRWLNRTVDMTHFNPLLDIFEHLLTQSHCTLHPNCCELLQYSGQLRLHSLYNRDRGDTE